MGSRYREGGQYIGGWSVRHEQCVGSEPDTSTGDAVRHSRHTITILLALAAAACGGDSAPDAANTTAETDPQLVFWASLQELCGQAFSGRVTESVPPDDSFEGQSLVMHVRSCDMAEIRIPFFVGDDRSRTWVITPTASGLRLKHDHRHEDGTEDAVTQYGGDTEGRGTATLQDFHADPFTADLVPTAETNIWTIEVHPGATFVYALRREGRSFRVEFDLTKPIDAPPPPWGA